MQYAIKYIAYYDQGARTKGQYSLKIVSKPVLAPPTGIEPISSA